MTGFSKKNNDIFLFGISFFALEILKFFYYANVLSKWKSATPCSSCWDWAGLVETSLDVQFCSPLSAKDAVDRGEFRVGEVFIFNLGWTVGGAHWYNFSLFTAVVEANLLCKEIELLTGSFQSSLDLQWVCELVCKRNAKSSA